MLNPNSSQCLNLSGWTYSLTSKCIFVGCKYWPSVSTSQPFSRKSSINCFTSSSVSPKPSIAPDFVRRPYSLVRFVCSKLLAYFACGLTMRYNRSTVSILCDVTSAPASKTIYSISHCDLKSGINVSMVVSGLSNFTAFTVSAHTVAPLSLSSSRFTEVITQCFTPIN